ncbi:hypothetical protein CR513_41027, partial [Mucuna pruriens]
MKSTFDKRFRPRVFKEGDLVLKKRLSNVKDSHGNQASILRRSLDTSRLRRTRTNPPGCVSMEAILPIEVEIPSLLIVMEAKLEEAEWMQTRFELAALCQGQMYQQRMKRVFDKRIRPRELQEGDMVLKKIIPTQKDLRGKWTPNYEGPYVVKRTFSRRAMILINMDGINLQHSMNSDAVKKFYP